MFLVVLSICLATGLHQYAAEGTLTSDDLQTTNVDQQVEIVEAHNDCRRNVKPSARNMAEMKWDPAVAENAQKWADNCDQNHSPRKSRVIGEQKCGENLAMSSHPISWRSAVDMWCDEQKDFTYGKGANSDDAVVGHYTQVVWSSSYKAGCGYAYCPGLRMPHYYVCQYCHAGNVGQIATPYKAGTPCDDCRDHCNKGLCTNPCEHGNDYSNCDSLMKDNRCKTSKLSPSCKASCDCAGKVR